MSSEILNSMAISASAMRAQGSRIRVISENIANAGTAANTPEDKPYTKQVISFKNFLDRETGVDLVKVGEIKDSEVEEYPLEYMPGHPGADENGYVKMPNVKPLVEMMDAREAQRSYEANLGMIEQARGMVMRTIDLLRA